MIDEPLRHFDTGVRPRDLAYTCLLKIFYCLFVVVVVVVFALFSFSPSFFISI